MIIFENEFFLVANKPVGIASHTVDNNKFGFIEYLESRINYKLYICHRLDKETSGVIVFAKDKETCRLISEEFAKRNVVKKYLFISENRLKENEIIHKSFIEKKSNKFVSIKNLKPNSETKIKFLNEYGKYRIYEAIPKTGKPHQIRLHCKDLGIPILGDAEHQGPIFSRLMLHSNKINFTFKNQIYSFECPPSKLFSKEYLLSNNNLANYINAIDRRKILFDLNSANNNTYRVIHTEGKYLRCDKLGDKLWFYWYKEDLPNKDELNKILSICKELEINEYKIQLMLNRGASPDNLDNLSNIIVGDWIATENSIKYVFKKNQGFSSGLFLDQRQNRKWVLENSSEQSVLNLFCYTGGFSLVAALGKAKEVVSVDTSKKTLEWAKENFKINNLDPNNYEFWSSDARHYVKGSIKRGRKFDLIICDPPSFARNKDCVFKIEKDFNNLIFDLIKILNPKGKILFSTNYEKWTREDLIFQIKDLKLSNIVVASSPPLDLDYELPYQDQLMKSVILEKLS